MDVGDLSVTYRAIYSSIGPLQSRSVCLQSRSVWLQSRSVCLQSRSVCLQSRSVCLQSRSVWLQSRSVCLQSRSVCLQSRSVWLRSMEDHAVTVEKPARIRDTSQTALHKSARVHVSCTERVKDLLRRFKYANVLFKAGQLDRLLKIRTWKLTLES